MKANRAEGKWKMESINSCIPKKAHTGLIHCAKKHGGLTRAKKHMTVVVFTKTALRSMRMGVQTGPIQRQGTSWIILYTDHPMEVMKALYIMTKKSCRHRKPCTNDSDRDEDSDYSS